ncbi:MAG: FtsX-like permease family protein [Acidobacteria bacterium]|nr:FtsX-like permease family protein [Acidobacteriota bacterium]
MKDFPLPLIRLFPTPFRVQFGADITEQIRRDAEHAHARGLMAGLFFRLLTALDLVRAAFAERRDPAWSHPGLPSPNQQDRATMLTSWLTDLRHAIYTLRRSPGFTVVTIATLALAIGVNVAIFSVVDAVLLRPLPYANPDRLVYIAASAPGSDFPDEFGVSNEFLVHYAERSQLLENVSNFNSFTNTLKLDDRIERVRMSWVHWTFFHTLEATPMIGRLPQPEDEDLIVVLSHRTWRTWFGSDPDVVGRTVEISGQHRTVIGVMGPEFWFHREDVHVWLSYWLDPETLNPGRFGDALVGRMAPGADHDSLSNELTALAGELPERFGGSPRYAAVIEQHRAVVRGIREMLVGPVEQALWVLLGSVAIVLLIACGNVANLFVVRAEGRQRDMAVRRALGAGRGALVRAQLAEAFLIAAAAAVFAVGLAWISVPALQQIAPRRVPRLGDAEITTLSLVFTAVAAAFTALACGLVPALRASSPRLTRLHESGRGSTNRRHWGRDALVVGQTALALVLLIGSGLLARSFWELRNVDPGYDIEDVFTFQIAPGDDHLVDAATFARFHADFAERLAALPGVESVGMVENLPLNEGVSMTRFLTEDTPGAEEEAGVRLPQTWAAHGYFETMGIEVLRGREFTANETAETSGNVVISETAAEALWPGEDPIGRQLRRADLETWDTVVGVVEDVMQNSFRDDPMGHVYFSFVGQPGNDRVMGSPAYVIRTTRTDSIGPEVRAAVREASPTAPMYRVFTMEGLAADSMADVSFTMLTIGVAASLALVLGALGLFGVLSYVVTQRTREIGVRMALGARAVKVQRMVIRQGGLLLAIGVVLGLVASAGVTRLLESVLFGVQPADLITYLGMSTTMVLIGLLASYLPARRASRVDPIESLRNE